MKFSWKFGSLTVYLKQGQIPKWQPFLDSAFKNIAIVPSVISSPLSTPARSVFSAKFIASPKYSNANDETEPNTRSHSSYVSSPTQSLDSSCYSLKPLHVQV